MTKNNTNHFKILVDADATPKAIKEVIIRAAINRCVLAFFVANQYLNLPDSEYIQSKVVASGFDKADEFILEKVNASDLVITSDIPLASEVIEKGAYVITPYGKSYDKNNIKLILAKRNYLTELRDVGLIHSKTKAFSNKAIYSFSVIFDRYLTKALKKD